ncbi:DUF3558 family protein [Solwaraspora sp. WMMD406]|uniref:DUF3558 family protein n=1 Tax=Solwaraspora sp. WMMD406 TaxID=3016095 RepID=UPI00241662E8|nr:DUF3558 family protein [Solwaraspora sp. WMMD406]MDG4765981.1 DUF3558 family protein [Solwaraspora sp. WMMD406]
MSRSPVTATESPRRAVKPRRARLRAVATTFVVVALALGGCATGTDPDESTSTATGSDQADPGPASGDDTGQPSTGEPADPPADVDPCALVTKDEAETLAGTPLDDARAVQQTCTYTGPVTGPTAQVEVYVGDGAAKFLDIERQLEHQLDPLPGVGDETYVGESTVFVNVDGRWVAVRLVRLNDPAENRAPLETVARTVAGRL